MAARTDLSARLPRAVSALLNHPEIDLVVGLGVGSAATHSDVVFGRRWLMAAGMAVLAYALVLGAAVSPRPLVLFPNGLPSRARLRLKLVGAHVLLQAMFAVGIALKLSYEGQPTQASALVAAAVAVSFCAAARGVWLLVLTCRASVGA
jgi:hypothetical protein